LKGNSKKVLDKPPGSCYLGICNRQRGKEMQTIITETTVDPRDGSLLPVEWFSAELNYTEYNLVLAPPVIPGTRPACILTLSLN
jgi:hypothetical protein